MQDIRLSTVDTLPTKLSTNAPGPSTHTVLRDIIRTALSQLITSGDYTAVLKSWGVAMGAVKEVRVNAG